MPERCSTDKWLAKNGCVSLGIAITYHGVPAATSEARATAFNKTNVSIYFNNLNSVMGKHKFDPGQIYNIDETGCTTVQTLKKVLARRGQKQVSQLH